MMGHKRDIIITGGSGFIGRHLTQVLSKDYNLWVLDLKAPESQGDNTSYVKLDCGDKSAIQEFQNRFEGDLKAVINLAAYYDFLNQESDRYSNLLKGLPALGEFYRAHKKKDSLFLQTSSMAALDPVDPGQQCHPDAPSVPRWSYPAFKVESENILREQLADENYSELVLAAVYSDYCELVPLFHFIDAHLNKTIHRWFHPASLKRGLTYVHIDDVVILFAKILKKDAVDRRYLVGETAPCSWGEVAESADKVAFKVKIPKLRVASWMAKAGANVLQLVEEKSFFQSWMIDFASEHYEFDISKTTDDFDWQPQFQLKQKLPTIINNALNDGRTWRKKNKARPWHPDDWES